MGLTQKLGTIPLAVFTDSSNNVGIGGAANASFKLQVSGSVNIAGNVTTTGSQFVQNGFYLTNTNGGATAGYTNMWGADDGIFFGLRNATGGAKFVFQSATSYDYTFPAATGTLALTSNLSAYLPLTGGTLTGALSGTSATFSSSVGANGIMSLGNDGTYGSNYKTLGLTGNSDGSHRIFAGTADDLYIAAATGRGINFWTNGVTSTRMFISSGGNVGIGTSSPSDRLQVLGSLRWGSATNNIVSSNDGSGVYMELAGTSTATRTLRIQGINDAANRYSAIKLQAGAEVISFETADAERMRIAANGLVTITGTGSTVTTEGIFFKRVSTLLQGGYISGNGGALQLTATNEHSGAYGTITFNRFDGSSTIESARITSNGSVCINSTTPGSLSPYLYNFNSDGSRINAAFEVSVATPGFTSIQFRNPNGAVGSININTSTVTYGGTSDYRLKEDLKDFNGLDKVCAIKVYDFKWKASEERNEGVLAHELMSVIPYAVNGEKDDIYEDGTIKSQMVDYSKIVPVLVKAIQELEARIKQLENK